MIKHYNITEKTPIAVVDFCKSKGIDMPKSKARFDWILKQHIDEISAIESRLGKEASNG